MSNFWWLFIVVTVRAEDCCFIFFGNVTFLLALLTSSQGVSAEVPVSVHIRSGFDYWADSCRVNWQEISVNHPEWSPSDPNQSTPKYLCFEHRQHLRVSSEAGLRGKFLHGHILL